MNQESRKKGIRYGTQKPPLFLVRMDKMNRMISGEEFRATNRERSGISYNRQKKEFNLETRMTGPVSGKQEKRISIWKPGS
jgi:hypothetical protein